jgi:hypothetical protein
MRRERPPRRRNDARDPTVGERFGDDMAADKAGGADHENAGHDLSPTWKRPEP